MTQGFDIDELERLLGDAAPGEWYQLYGKDDPTIRATADAGFIIYDEGGHTARDAALIVTLHNSAPALIAELRELRAENARLKSEVVSFCGPWAAQYARETGLEPGHLHPTHYDILEKAGARMASFTRAALGEPQ